MRARSLFKMALGSEAIRFRIKSLLGLSAVLHRPFGSKRGHLFHCGASVESRFILIADRFDTSNTTTSLLM